MSLPPLPMTVIAGYLGAGKTSLINRLLCEAHGVRLLVMVNDFGAINIDEKLLASSGQDTLTLTNGCVCCTMGADLFLAIGDALERRPRPDHLLIEASGIADPSRIANAARAEPELRYGGIVSVVDGVNFMSLISDGMVAPQLNGQVACADLIAVSKTQTVVPSLWSHLHTLSKAPLLLLDDSLSLAPFILGPKADLEGGGQIFEHPAYVSWSFGGDRRLTRAQLEALMAKRPRGVFRLKGVVRGFEGVSWVIQIVGADVSIEEASECGETALVAIGLKERMSVEALASWWDGGICVS